MQHFDIVIRQRFAIQPFEPVHFSRNIIAQRRPIERCSPGVPAKALCIGQIFGKMRSVHQQLLRHTAADNAGTTDPVFLRNRHARAVRCGNARSPNPARSSADDEQVVIKFCHDCFFLLRRRYGYSFGLLPTAFIGNNYRPKRLNLALSKRCFD